MISPLSGSAARMGGDLLGEQPRAGDVKENKRR
jgi:hypothetical protein